MIGKAKPFQCIALFVCCLISSLPVHADSIQILAPQIPSIITESGLGRDAEIVRAVLAACGYEPEFQFMPFGRHLLAFTESVTAEAVITVPLSSTIPGEGTNAYIWYQMGAISLSSRNFSFEKPQDLAGKVIITFKNGKEMLGFDRLDKEQFAVQEFQNEKTHPLMLFSHRVEVVLHDGVSFGQRVFEAKRRTGEIFEVDFDQSVDFFPLFPPRPYKAVFKDPKVASDFERCFQTLDRKGDINRINQKWVSRHRSVIGFRYLGH